MEMNNEPEGQSKLKEGIITALKCLATISSAASTINPIFGVVASVIRAGLSLVDDTEAHQAIQKLKDEFDSLNNALDKLSEQSRHTLKQIKKVTVDGQYVGVEQNLRNQFRTFMEMVKAQPKYLEQKKEDFLKSYKDDKSDQNLHTLYDGVTGKVKLFSEPMLEVYKEHSEDDRGVMERLCTRLTHLFCIGLIAFMGYAALSRLDVENEKEQWAKRMEEVEEKMQETLDRCNKRDAPKGL